MYNEKQKKEFIDSYKGITSDNYLPNLFKKCEVMEEEFGKDVCDFIKPEIIKLLISFNASSSQTLHVRRSLLRQYTEFCCNRKLSLDSINHFEEINTEEIEDCVNVFLKERRYITPDTLSDLCEQLLNPVDKYIICALYEGIKGKNCEELLCLKLKDIDFESCEAKLVTGRTVAVSRECMNYMEASCQADSYISALKSTPFPEEFEEYAFKVISHRLPETLTDTQKKTRVMKKVATIREELEAPEITIPRLINSGFMFRLQQRADELGVSYREIIDKDTDFLEALKEKYDMKHVKKTNIYANAKGYLE